MNLPTPDKTLAVDENGKILSSTLAEDYRLHEQLKPKPATFRIDDYGNRVDIPAKRGIDIKSCDFMDAVNWLADTRIKKSETGRMYVLRHLQVRFPTEFARYKKQINQRYRLEMEMIESNGKNDSGWLGEVSYQNMVRLDNSLTNPKTKTVKLKNENYKIIRN